MTLATARASENGDLTIKEAKQLGLQGDWERAETLLRSSLAADQNGVTLDAVHVWNELGNVHESTLRLDEATSDYQRAIQLCSRLGAEAVPDLVVGLNNLGSVAELRGDYRSAERFFRDALNADEQGVAADPAITGAVYANLAISIQKQGRWKEPLPLYERGLELLRKSRGENSTEYATALIDYGLLEYEIGNYAQALPLQRKACEILESSSVKGGRANAHALNNLGLTLLELGAISDAESAFRKALAIDRVSQNSLDLAQTLSSLGSLEKNAGRLAEARRDEEEALAVAMRASPHNPSLVAQLNSNLGALARQEGKTREAVRLFDTALNIWLSTEGKTSNYAATLSHLAGVQASKRHHRRAASMYAEALRIDEVALGKDHPRVANDLTNVGIEFYRDHNCSDAITTLQRAEQIDESTFGQKDVRVARALRTLGVAYGSCKELPQAEEFYRKALRIEEANPDNIPELISWLSEDASLLWQQQKFAEAEQAWVRVNGLKVRSAISAEAGRSALYAH